ncbi:hypothetical protein DPEC_G00039740 [Dallia pectoralis]|uniref:Uncharacterized protein n=1 Tax=Dallia pectoralis TaxID=75939 RepID=A0ACC2HEY2_DALPE|nr:hypothetical protein DPEC_G00039740 [Dallia pectoralis]
MQMRREQVLTNSLMPSDIVRTLIKELGLEGHVTSQQVSKKWENQKNIYKDLKTLKTGSGTDAGEVTASSWQYYEDMHEVLGARPSMDPPVLVASFHPDADPIPLLMAKQSRHRLRHGQYICSLSCCNPTHLTKKEEEEVQPYRGVSDRGKC